MEEALDLSSDRLLNNNNNIKKTNLNKTLFQIHLQLANEWDNVWHLLQDTIHAALENEIQNTYKHLDKKLDRMKQVHNTIKTTSNPHMFHPRVVNNTNITFSKDELNIFHKGFKYNCNFKPKN